MCGIAGLFAYGTTAPGVSAAELTRIRDAMMARGPDGAGQWVSSDGLIGLAHRRLSIIDLSERASQPMWTADNKLAVTFNGEIYNYRELRDELLAKGYVFRTTSDTEVLLHLYRELGSSMVGRLRGMFAFGLWDVREQLLLLARDPYGIKPLYYSDCGSTVRFASQVRALLAGGAIADDPDPAGWAGFYLMGSVPEPFTTHRAIKALPAGTMLLYKRGKGSPGGHRYFSIAEAYVDAEHATVQATGTEFTQAIASSVASHLIADVPVGCFLSAGLDSCGLLALMSTLAREPIRAVTLSFSEFAGTPNDEAPLASLVAATYGARHVVRRVDAAEFRSDLPRILAAMDQPTLDGINTWFVSKATREQGLKVAISGLGGDELLGGYPTFSDVPSWVQQMRWLAALKPLGPLVRRAIDAAQALVPVGSPKIAGMLEYGYTFAGAYMLRRGLFMPWELDRVLDPQMAVEGLEALNPRCLIASAIDPQPSSDFARIAALESSLYMRNQLLRDTDWASMAHSLEVRVPLVDHVLLASVARMRPRPNKRAMGALAAKPLPSAIIDRPKTGFSTPVAHWLDNLAHVAADDAPAQPMHKPLTARGSRKWAQKVAMLWQNSVRAQREQST